MTSLLCTESRTVLILGTGYLGRALAERLREAGHIPLTADIDPKQAIYEADMTDSASMHRLAARIPEPCLIVMCASTRGGGTEDYLRLYTKGAENTLEAFPGKPVIFCSSTSVYGITDGRWVTEEHNVYPTTEKRRLLLQAEQTILAAQGTVVRLAALYGPGRCILVSDYCAKGAALPGNMDRWMNYIHRDDAVSALFLLCTLRHPPRGIYNVADRTPMQLSEIYAYLSGLLGIPAPPVSAAFRRPPRRHQPAHFLRPPSVPGLGTPLPKLCRRRAQRSGSAGGIMPLWPLSWLPRLAGRTH